MATMEMATVGRTVLLAHAPGAIQESDWSQFLGRMEERDYDGLLIWAPGAAPNQRQRRSVIRAWGGQLPKVGVVTESMAVQGVISILTLLMNDRIRGFQLGRLEAALEHVETRPKLHPEVQETFARLRAKVPERNDETLFAKIRRDHHAALEAAARMRCASRADAEDLVHDTFELAFLHPETLKRVESPRAWLKALLHHRFVSVQRRRATERWVDLSPWDEVLLGPDPEPEPAWATMTAEQVWEAAGHLEPDLRQTFELYEREGLSYRAISQRLGVPVNTVGSRINRARAQLRERLRLLAE